METLYVYFRVWKDVEQFGTNRMSSVNPASQFCFTKALPHSTFQEISTEVRNIKARYRAQK
jgi:hypothetical protein